MIKMARIPDCFVCGAEWLPEKPEYREHPNKIPRCSSCKSRRWNDDDPTVQAEKQRPKALTPAQQAKQQTNAANAKVREKLVKREQAALARVAVGKPQAAQKWTLCKHRILATQCPICSKVGK